jgi:GT2 family glycosyltransferase
LSSHYSIAVGVATAGRRDLLSCLLLEIARQVRLPDVVVVCPSNSEDFDHTITDRLPYQAKTVFGPKGSSAQRNAILDVTRHHDVVVFFDDDFVPADTFLERVEQCFSKNQDVVASSGQVIADGVLGPGIEFSEARALLRNRAGESAQEVALENQYNAYGCNMALRLKPICENGLRFDENLPFYGWLEDVDFCRRLARFGRVVRDPNLMGVHLGVKRGRTSGYNFGYSQIANPIYLWRKGTLGFDRALGQMSRNVASNLMKSFDPEPWIDRHGRVRGNARAFRDLLRGRLDPRKILDSVDAG